MTSETIERRAFRNTRVGTISFLLNFGQTLLLVPILLKTWGPERYGVWVALMAGSTLLQALNRGHQNYIGNELNMQYHGDLGQFRSTLGSSLRIAYVLGIVEFAICAIIIATGSLARVLSIPPPMVTEQRLSTALLLLMATWMTFGSAGGIISRILIPAGKFYECEWAGILARLAQFASIALVALAGGTIVEACLSFSLVQSITTLLLLWYTQRLLPNLYPWWRDARWGEGLRGLRRSLVLTVTGMIQQVSSSGLVLLVSILFAATAVPSFSTLRTMTNTATAITTLLISAVLPDLVRFHVTKEVGKVADTLDGHWFLAGLLVNGGILLTFPVIEPLYRVWTRGQIAFDPGLFLLLLVSTSLVNVGAGLNSYLAGINDFRAQVFVTLGRATFLYMATFFLREPFGIIAIGIGSVIAELVASVVLPIVFVRERLSEGGGQGRLQHWALALVPPGALLISGAFVVARGANLGWAGAAWLPVLCATYYFHWKALNVDVRTRIGAVILSKVPRNRAR